MSKSIWIILLIGIVLIQLSQCTDDDIGVKDAVKTRILKQKERFDEKLKLKELKEKEYIEKLQKVQKEKLEKIKLAKREELKTQKSLEDPNKNKEFKYDPSLNIFQNQSLGDIQNWQRYNEEMKLKIKDFKQNQATMTLEEKRYFQGEFSMWKKIAMERQQKRNEL